MPGSQSDFEKIGFFEKKIKPSNICKIPSYEFHKLNGFYHFRFHWSSQLKVRHRQIVTSTRALCTDIEQWSELVGKDNGPANQRKQFWNLLLPLAENQKHRLGLFYSLFLPMSLVGLVDEKTQRWYNMDR